VEKIGGIHGLRHAYATHQLEAGLPVHRLQRLLGHQDIHSTSAAMRSCTPQPSR
jgi:site-specific recombinase XerD